MRIQKAKVFILGIFFLFLFPSLSWALHIECPERVLLGDAFLIRVSSSYPTWIKLTWLRRRIKFPLQCQGKKRFGISLFLGSDVKSDHPGVFYLKLQWAHNGHLSRRISLLPRGLSYTRITVSRKYSALSRDALKRYFREKRKVEKLLLHFSPVAYFRGNFIYPLHFPISSPYGRVRIINGKQHSIHLGVDFKSGYGKRVRAINRGKVVLCGPLLFSGNSVFIDHGKGIVSEYFHLSRIVVSPGQMVKKGEVIGLTGRSGRVTGPHLHLGISILGEAVDPISFLKRF